MVSQCRRAHRLQGSLSIRIWLGPDWHNTIAGIVCDEIAQLLVSNFTTIALR